MRHGILAILIGSALVTSAAHADSGWRYAISSIKVFDLGTMGGKESVANDINDKGEIVGWANLADGAQHAFLWRNGAMEDITPFRETFSDARGINNFTSVVGYLNGMKDSGPHAFYWDSVSTVVRLDEAWTDPKDIPLCGSGAVAEAINDDGVIVGDRYGGCNPPGIYIARAARWASWSSPWQEISPLGHAPKSNHAEDINAAGAIVGWDHDSETLSGAIRWYGAGSAVPYPTVIAPASPVDESMFAFGNNASNGVVGSLTLRLSPGEYVTRAYYWNGSSAESSLLPSLIPAGASVAYELNKEAFSVGYSDDPRDRRAVVWHPHFGIQVLPLPPGAGTDTIFVNYQCQALAVNSRSATGLVQAVGFCNVGGKRHAMVWNISTYRYDVPSDSP